MIQAWVLILQTRQTALGLSLCQTVHQVDDKTPTLYWSLHEAIRSILQDGMQICHRLLLHVSVIVKNQIQVKIKFLCLLTLLIH